MRKIVDGFTIGFGILLVATEAMAQSTSTSPAKPTSSTQATITTQSTTSTSSATSGAFDKLSPGGQKIAMALCNAQAGGCPPPQSTTQSPSSPNETTASTQPPTLTRDQIAAMKQRTGWGQVFKQMQQNGQIPAGVKNLGQLVSGRYQAHTTATRTVMITTASGKSQVVGTSGRQGGRASVQQGGSVSNAGGGNAGLDNAHANAGSQGGAHGK